MHTEHPRHRVARNLSIREACEAIGVSRRTIYNLIAAGKLGTIKVGKRRLVPPAEIARMTSLGVRA